MASNLDLREISKKRLKSSEILISAQDWDGAPLMLGLPLECAIKAVICKTLHLGNYPERTHKSKIDQYFMTHDFDQLLLVSGMDNIFGVRGPVDTSWNWSQFMEDYVGDWWSMKYDPTKLSIWNEEKIKERYNNLMSKQGGVINEIKKRRLW